MPVYPALDLEQTQAEAFLKASLKDNVPALLFTGPEGVGKEYTAIEFARRLSCANDPVCALQGEICDSCRMAVELEHPGIQIIHPTPTQGTGEKPGDDEVDVGKVLEARRQDLFEPYEFKKKGAARVTRASIRVARARAMIKRAATKPFGGYRNIFIVVDAHTMREEAQNALLKLVEEPPDRCALIFITPNPDAILYTIRSRCQRVRFAPLGAAVIESLLLSYYDVTKKLAGTAAELCRGSIRRAREIASDYDDEERSAVYEILRRIQDAPESWVVGQALLVARGASRDSVARFLHEFSSAYRDIMTGDATLFVNKDRARLLNQQIKQWDRRKLPGVLDKILATRDGILRRNLNIEASLVHLFLDIKHLGC
jgi:DNA polymerase-3 subunit delta'